MQIAKSEQQQSPCRQHLVLHRRQRQEESRVKVGFDPARFKVRHPIWRTGLVFGFGQTFSDAWKWKVLKHKFAYKIT